MDTIYPADNWGSFFPDRAESHYVDHDRVLQMELAGKSSVVGKGGEKDPIDNPLAYSTGVTSDVLHVNDVYRQDFDDSRARHMVLAQQSFAKPGKRNDVQYPGYHRMHYETELAVGNRPESRPDYGSYNLYNFHRKLGASDFAKRETVIPGRADIDSGYRPTLFYARGQLDVPRALHIERQKKRLVEELSTRDATVASHSDRGMAAPGILRHKGQFLGVRHKRQLNTIQPSSSNVLANRRPDVTNKNLNNLAHVQTLEYRQSLADNLLAEMAPYEDSAADDSDQYFVYPSGKGSSRGVQSGAATTKSTPTVISVRAPQMQTARYNNHNPLDTRRVWHTEGLKNADWGFDTPIRAKMDKGMLTSSRTTPNMVGQRPSDYDESITRTAFLGTATRAPPKRVAYHEAPYTAHLVPSDSYKPQQADVGEITHHQRGVDMALVEQRAKSFVHGALLSNPLEPKTWNLDNLRKTLSRDPNTQEALHSDDTTTTTAHLETRRFANESEPHLEKLHGSYPSYPFWYS